MMNCLQCGGLLRISSTGPVIYCDFCGQTTRLGSQSEAEAGLVLLERQTETACPCCAKPLTLALLDSAPMEYCPDCRGMLLEDQLFAQLVQTRRWAYQGPDVMPVPIDPRELQDHRTCPGCETAMERHPYSGPGNVVVDSCFPCGWIWLDAGELARIEQAPGRRAWQ